MNKENHNAKLRIGKGTTVPYNDRFTEALFNFLPFPF